MDNLINQKGLYEKIASKDDYYEIRLESIGGLGANVCGKMLGEMGIKYLGVNSSNFASYGSEKTGTPVKGHIRYCREEKEINIHYPVVNPDLLVVFHQALLNDTITTKGIDNNSSVIINLNHSLEDNETITIAVSDNNKISDNTMFWGIEAQKIAIETKSRINVVMLGAIIKVMGISHWEVGKKICEDILGKKYPETLKNNIAGIKRGYEEVLVLKNKKNYVCKESDSSFWGYNNAPIGGINPRFGNSVTNDLSPSRQGYIPVFIKERCINCGLCHSTCPDMVFQFFKGTYKGREMMVNEGLDYYHCKGCLRCVDVCPVNALVKGADDNEKKEFFIPNKELVRLPKYYEKSGADGYITSESYLTEKRVDGGEV